MADPVYEDMNRRAASEPPRVEPANGFGIRMDENDNDERIAETRRRT
jgi:hypothetical protein